MASAEQSTIKAGCLTALMMIACLSSSCEAFQSIHVIQRGGAPSSSNFLPHTSSSALFAEGFGSNNNNNNNKKKGKKQKYTIEDKSYGSSSSSPSSLSSNEIVNTQTPEEFFTTYNEWMPLFREYTQHSLAHSYLTTNTDTPPPSTTTNNKDTLWGISTLENRNPWRLLPSKPESAQTLSHIGTFLDEWQRSLLDIPIDTLTKEEDIGKGNNDLHFLEEGRRVIAVTRFHVLDGDDYTTDDNNDNENNISQEEWEMELFRTCWSEMGKLMSEDIIDTGSLVVLPNTNNFLTLEKIQQFVQTKLVQPAEWMGRSDDWEIVAMERGELGVRLLYKLSAIPDLSEKYSPPEEDG